MQIEWLKQLFFSIQKLNVNPARRSKDSGLLDVLAAIGWPHSRIKVMGGRHAMEVETFPVRLSPMVSCYGIFMPSAITGDDSGVNESAFLESD